MRPKIYRNRAAKIPHAARKIMQILRASKNCDCDKNFDGGSRNGSNASGVRVEFLGAIFVSSSKRRVSVETAREIARIAHEKGAKCVGVFALSSEKHSAAACECKNFSGKTCGEKICEDKIYAGTSGGLKFYENECDDLNVNLNANCAAPASTEDLNSEIFGAEALGEEQILKICSLCELDCAQIYGRISADFKVRLNTAGIEAWQVLSIGAEMPPIEGLSCDRILFDAKGVSLGGNGVSFDWDLLRHAGLGYEGQYGAASSEKYCAGSTVQSAEDAKDDLERITIRKNFGEEKFYAECVENSVEKLVENDNHRAANGDEASKIVRDVAQSSEAKPAIENYDCDAKGGEKCGANAYAASRSIGTKPAKEGADYCGANDYEADALDIAEGSKAGGSSFAKDDSADKRGDDPQNSVISFILAGGIGAQNVLEALALHPYAIDLNSCVEDARGIKEPQKISEILRIIESADGAAD